MLQEELRKGKRVLGRWGNRREGQFKPVFWQLLNKGSKQTGVSGELSVLVHKWQGSCVMHCCHFWLPGLIPDTCFKSSWISYRLYKDFFQIARADCHVSTFCSEGCILSSGPEKSIYEVSFMTLMLNRRSSVCAAPQTCHIANTGTHHLGALLTQARQVQVQTLEVRAASLLGSEVGKHLCCSASMLLVAIACCQIPRGNRSLWKILWSASSQLACHKWTLFNSTLSARNANRFEQLYY